MDNMSRHLAFRGRKPSLFMLRGVIYFSIAVLFLLVIKGSIQSETVRTNIILGIVFLFPGFVVFNWIRGYLGSFELVEKIFLYFILSFLFNFLLSLIAIITKLDIVNFIYLLTFSYLVLAIVDLLKIKNDLKPIKFAFKVDPISVIILLIVVLFALLTLKFGSFIKSDARFHIAFSNQLLHSNVINYLNPFFIDGGNYWIYAYTPFYPLLAASSYLSGSEAVNVWQKMATIFSIVSFCAIFTFAKQLFLNRKIGFLAVIILLISYLSNFIEYPNSSEFQLLAFPLGLSLYIFLPGLFYFTFRVLRSRIKSQTIGNLIILVALSLLLCAIHFYYLLLYLMAIFAFGIFVLLFRQKKSKIHFLRLLMIGSLVIFFSGILMIFRYLQIPEFDQKQLDLSRQFYQINSLKIGSNLLIVHPKFFFTHIGQRIDTSLPIFGYLALPFLFIWKRKTLWAKFIIPIMILIPLIVFNPYAVKVLVDAISPNKVWRLYQILPMIPLFAYLFYQLLKYIYSKFPLKISESNILSFFGIIVIALFIILNPKFIQATKLNSSNLIERNKAISTELIKGIEDHIDSRSVILANKNVSEFIPVFTKDYVVAGGPGLSVLDQTRRQQMGMKVLSGKATENEAYAYLKKYQIKYVICGVSGNALRFWNQASFVEAIYHTRSYMLFKVN